MQSCQNHLTTNQFSKMMMIAIRGEHSVKKKIPAIQFFREINFSWKNGRPYLEVLNALKLISRKIWVAEKFLNLHTVSGKTRDKLLHVTKPPNRFLATSYYDGHHFFLTSNHYFINFVNARSSEGRRRCSSLVFWQRQPRRGHFFGGQRGYF